MLSFNSSCRKKKQAASQSRKGEWVGGGGMFEGRRLGKGHVQRIKHLSTTFEPLRTTVITRTQAHYFSSLERPEILQYWLIRLME